MTKVERKILKEVRAETVHMIRTKMKERGVSQTDLAERLGVSKGNVSQMLSDRNLTLRSLSKVAQALGCEIKITLWRQKCED